MKTPLAELPRDTVGPESTVAALAPEDDALCLSMVLPTYNEARTLGAMVGSLDAVLAARLERSYEIIVVDDDSPDGTAELALGLCRSYPRLRVVRRRGERGLATAVVRGWQAARGRLVGVIDADLQHPPAILAALVDAIDGGADLAVASRHLDGGGVGDWNLLRRVVSRGAQLLGLALLPGVVGRISDPMSGCFIVRRDAIAGVAMRPVGYKILLEVLARGRVRRVAEAPYVFGERADGESKATLAVYADYLRHLVRLRLDAWRGSRFVRFALVGLGGVAVDMLVLFALGDPRTLGWSLPASKVVAAEAAIVNNFWWNDRWTFGDVAAARSGRGSWLRRLASFNAICGLGMVWSVLLLTLQVRWLQLNRYLANAVAIGLVTAWNYWLNVKLSWRVPTAPPALTASSRVA